MLRRAAADICQKAYTCSCLPRTLPVVNNHGIHSASNFVRGGSHRWFNTTVSSLILDRDDSTKHTAYRLAEASKFESLDNKDKELDLEGLTQAGVTIPSMKTPSMLINGTRFDELPIVHIRSSPNNTIIQGTDHTGTVVMAYASCGTEGFKHVKKSSSVAAQATGQTVGVAMMKKNAVHIRVCIRGLGVGRLPALKGLQMAGLQIISLTDRTRFKCNGPRSRKKKRL